jgi:predicted YcjX-like family ATPase
MTNSERKSHTTRVVIAITALTPVRQLWREALQHLEESQAELLALFLEDDQWHRAASLPFTREISRLRGTDEDFTSKRASEVHEEAIDRAQRQLQQLAAEADHEVAFEVLRESDQNKVRDIVTETQTVLIVPSGLANRPQFAELAKSGCRIILISA